jgi:hypothetical protein
MGCEQPSQYQRTLVRFLGLSVPICLNFTLASNNILNGVGDGSQIANIFPMDVVEGEGAVESSGTTKFVSDSNVVSATKTNVTRLDPSFLKSSTDMTSQDIKDFLAKPVILASGNFGVTDTFSTFPEFITPADILNISNMMFEKTKGYLGFRATTVLRLVINATRFQQGRYNLQFIPIGGAVVTSTNPARQRITGLNSTLTSRTQLPHVEIDLSCDTEATIVYPWNSAVNYYPLSANTNATSYGSVGLFKIYPYSALEAGSGDTTCGYTLWAHFEDVELIGAAVPQSGKMFYTKTKKKNETEVEQDSSGMGPVSSTLMRVSNAAKIFTAVPLLSSYASMTSWYAELLSGAASAFGWAKPVNLEHSTRVTQNYLPYSANVDGPDESFPLSFSYTNQVGKAEGFSGTDVDELDFTYICTIPAYYAKVTWTDAIGTGATIFSINVGPRGALNTRTVTARSILDLAPFQYVSYLFKQWRGSMVYKFKFVKTEFHSGRLAVSFSPFDPHVLTPSVSTLADTVFLHRQIIDIRETNEFTFVVPYISSSPYTDVTSFTGRFSVMVVDPLIAPSSVTGAIQLIIEQSMCSDAEFAIPARTTLTPVYGITPQSGEPFSSEENVCANYRGFIGSSVAAGDDSINSLFCVGEKISSFRTLIKMPTPLAPVGTPVAAPYMNIIPFALPFTNYTPGTTTYTLPSFVPDLFSVISQFYVYGRGGVRLKFLDNTSVTAAEPFSVYITSSTPSTAALNSTVAFEVDDVANNNTSTARSCLPTFFYKAGYSGEVQVPQYMAYHSRLISDCLALTGGLSYATGIGSINPKIGVTRASVPPVNNLATLLRSASDDANFGVFLAIPPMNAV